LAQLALLQGDIDLTAASPAAPLRPLMQVVDQFNEPTSRRRLLSPQSRTNCSMSA
jgi:hypothetical protein